MSFVEVEFLFFLPLAFIAYWLLPRNRIAQNGWLLLMSWVFYACWNWRLLPLLVGGALLDFGVARRLGALEGSRQGYRRLLLGISLAWNLGALAFFKYVGFFAESFNLMLSAVGLHASVPVLHVLLPLGISFYTLQRLGYVFDVYLGRYPPCRSLLDFLLFAGYFPQLTAGPISRGNELLPQLAEPRGLLPQRLASAAATMLMGYVLKAWIADSVGQTLVDPVFADDASFSTSAHWAAIIGYMVQVFSDFAGYSLIAIGCSLLFGIELAPNFDSPFLSRSLPEFWRRWHMTLNRWLFDYIYGQLSTGRTWLRGRLDLCMMIVFLASGLWHGAAATFVLWGVMHGLGMIVHRRWDEYYRGLCRADRRYVQRRRSAGYAFVSWLLTQGFFLLSLVPFRSQSIAQTGRFFTGLVHSSGADRPDIGITVGISLLLAFGTVILYHLLDLERWRRFRERFFDLPAWVRGAAYGMVVVFLMLFVPVGASTFIYRQF
ncbi:MAG: MBOAT family protein [Proteobacteria bacterium]|nr:MBOAT family protein [Pseudomonadota bacterium]